LAIAFGDGRVWVEDTVGNKQVWTKTPGPKGEAPVVAFAPGPAVLAVALGCDIRFWNPRADTQVREAIAAATSVRALAYSPSGNYLAVAGDEGKVTLWDVSTGKHEATFVGHTDRVSAVAWSVDGRLLITGADDGTVRLWPVPAALATGKGGKP
jgi:WD40 repeat protein